MDSTVEYDLKNHPEKFYKDRDNNIYPYYKESILLLVNPYEPATFLPILKDMDYPFFERVWISMLIYCIINKRDLRYVFGKYIARMRLRGFYYFRFEHSEYNKDITNYHEIINKKIENIRKIKLI